MKEVDVKEVRDKEEKEEEKVTNQVNISSSFISFNAYRSSSSQLSMNRKMLFFSRVELVRKPSVTKSFVEVGGGD